MRALRVYGPHDVRLEDVPRPTAGPGEVVVRVAAVAICGTDMELITGIHGALERGLQPLPFTPGHEWSGTVAEVGEGVTHLRVGDAVIGETGIGCLRCPLCLTGHHQLCPQGSETGITRRDGAMREFHVQNADFVHRFAGTTPDVAALVEPASVGVYACHRTAVSPLDRVAIVGGGAIGQCCLQAARAFGARFAMLVSRSKPKLDLAARCGADLVVNSATTDLQQAAMEATDGALFDVVIEAAGTDGAFHDALQLGGYASRIGIVGYSSPEPLGFGLTTLIDREQTVIGLRGSPNVYPQTIDLVGRGVLQLEPLISHRFPLDEFAEALQVAKAGGPDVMRVVLTLQP
jgi:L-iditol 2-dehydrogenase